MYQELIQFMEDKTIDIMFEEFEKYKEAHQNEIQSIRALQIPYIMFEYPLRRLLHRILRDKIDG